MSDDAVPGDDVPEYDEFDVGGDRIPSQAAAEHRNIEDIDADELDSLTDG